MPAQVVCNKDAIREAYEDVRDDKTETSWAVFRFEGNEITTGSTGEDYEAFVNEFRDDEKLFGFLRVVTGDELSKRAKFAFVTWIGEGVGPMKRAKMSSEKALVKEVVTNFAVEISAEDKSDLDIGEITKTVIKAGGANYGSGQN